MAASSCVLVRIDAKAALAVSNGEYVRAGQAIGKSCCRDGNEVAPRGGTVRHIQLDPISRWLLVYIEVHPPRQDAA